MKKGRPAKRIINGKLECANCKRILDIFNFPKSKRYKNGYKPYCNTCFMFYRKKREKGSNLSAKEFGLWLKNEKQECIYCKIDLLGLKKEKHLFFGNCFHRLTIDRKDSNKGYDRENISLACYRCNRIKSNIFSFEEMLVIGKILENKRKSQN